MEQNTKNDPKKAIFQNFVKQKYAFLSHVPRILQSKNEVPRPKSVLYSLGTDGQTDIHESENRGHPFRVSGFFSNFPSTYHQGAVQ